MCVEISNNNVNASLEISQTKGAKKVSYSIKKLLKQLFKQPKQSAVAAKKAESLESLESLENSRNSDLESECASVESCENEANERLSCQMEDFEFADITSVPVHFVRTEHGTFFWTAQSELPADNDLVEPLACSTFNQLAVAQFQDRWAQA